MRSPSVPLFVLVASAALVPSRALAWASVSTLVCEDIHQTAIANVLATYRDPAGNPMPNNVLTILQDQQKAVDKHQLPSESNMHSMTGIANASETEAQQRPIYIGLTEKFLTDEFTAALAAKRSGQSDVGFTHLGNAIHPMQDATSPAHKVFQTWRYDESWLDKGLHLWKENRYPAAGTPFRSDLESAVRWALDIYFEKTPLPAHFFKGNGELDLPSANPPPTTTPHP